jgi:hypothetical protein
VPRGQRQPFFLHIVAPEEEKLVRRTFGCVNIRVACHVVSCYIILSSISALVLNNIAWEGLDQDAQVRVSLISGYFRLG